MYCLAVTYCKDVRARTGLRDQRGGSNIRQLLAGSSRVSAQPNSLPQSGPPVAEATSTESAAPLAGTAPAILPRTPRPSIRQQLLRTVTPSASPRPASTTHPRCSPARTDHQQAEARQGLRLVHETRGRRHPGRLDARCQGVEQQEIPGGSDGALPLAHGSPLEYGQHTPQAGSTGGGYRREQAEDDHGRMVDDQLRMDLPDMEPLRAKTGGGHHQISAATRGDCAHPELLARASDRGGDPAIQLHCDAAQAGAARSQHSNLCSRGVPEGASSGRNLSPLRAPLRQCHHEPHRGLDEKRHVATDASGQAIGQPLLPAASIVRTPAASTAPLPSPPPLECTHEGVSALAATTDAAACPSDLPCVRFRGGSNSCYLNSFLNCMWLAAHAADCCHMLPKAFWVKSERPHVATRLMGLRLLGWPHPQQQHDVAELVDFLQPRLLASPLPGCWETRQHTPEGLVSTASVGAQRCIQLPLDIHNPTPEVQELVDRWHSQGVLQAFTELPPWLFLQLPRFFYHAPGWPVKQTQAYLLTHHISLPKFSHSDRLNVLWVNYRVLAYIQHHGHTPTTGHYTTVVPFRAGPSWLLDDDKDPQLMTSAQLDHLSANVYVVLVVREAAVPEASFHSGLHPPARSSNRNPPLPDTHGQLADTEYGSEGGGQLGLPPHVSADSAARAAQCSDDKGRTGREIAAGTGGAPEDHPSARSSSRIHGGGDTTEPRRPSEHVPCADSNTHQLGIPG